MQIRVLVENEIPLAVQLSRQVFDHWIRPNWNYDNMKAFFDGYVQVPAITEMVRSGRLFLWGVYEGNQLVAVSGMQREGHITMLYVHPYFAKRHFARELLKEMKRFAYGQLGLETVSVSAMPAWTATYFQRNGFVSVDGNMDKNRPYIQMQAYAGEQREYKIRPVEEKKALKIILGFLGVITLSVAGYSVYLLMLLQ